MNQEFAYPIAVFCIIATEFCERFAFSGLRTILSLYLRNILLFSENISTLIYHIFIMVCYIVPLAGAICADAYFGRYSTIRNFGIIYLIGHIVMFLAAVPIINLSPM
uniref:Solute carrier family 15 member 1-like n=1 Tax=Diabrotica virgifera virgifera TaxID=50390 RepID=A0A6P7GGQ0_DIAVI